MKTQIRRKARVFPYGACLFYVLVAGLTRLHIFFSAVFPFEQVPGETLTQRLALVGGTLAALLTVEVGLLFVLIWFPVQWLSKEEAVYPFAIWRALFYSHAWVAAFQYLVFHLHYHSIFLIGVAIRVFQGCLFLTLYLTGEEKEDGVKQAMIQVVTVLFLITVFLTHYVTGFLMSV